MTEIRLSKLDKRLPNWNIHEFIPRNCPICDSEGRSLFIRPDDVTIRICDNCGLFFVSPCPSDKQLNEFYLNYDSVHRNAKSFSGSKLVKQYKRANLKNDFRYQVINSIKSFKGKRILDIGFGRGYYSFQFDAIGAHVTGIEIDDVVIEFAKKHLQLKDIQKIDLLQFQDQDGFDLILLFDLIEHVAYPYKYMEKIYSLLRPGGFIAISTPNATNALNQMDPILFRVDLEHLQYFTTKTINIICKEFNLEIVHVEQVGHPYLIGLTENISMISKLKILISCLPVINRIYSYFVNRLNPERSGDYILFCMLKKV